MSTLYQKFTLCTPTPHPQIQTGIYLILGGPKACQDAEGFLQEASLKPTLIQTF